jgi:hypothetical protein
MSFRTFALLLLAVLLALTACARPTPRPELKWTGQGLEGLSFAVREMAGTTVHYAAPTMPEQAEALAKSASLAARDQALRGRPGASGTLDVWVVPSGHKWPVGLNVPPVSRGFRAGAPGIVVGRQEAVTDTTGQGLPQALAVALSQAKESPAYAVDWLHEGLGAALSRDLADFPTAAWRRVLGTGADVDAAAAIKLLQQKPAAGEQEGWALAARALAVLTMDRWGVAWTDQYPMQPGDLTPAKAVVWATGGADEAAAITLFQERIDLIKHLDSNQTTWSMADMSPVRVEPKLAALPTGPGPMANYSPHTYDLDARYDPDRLTVTGTEQLTWRNGEGIPVETLYFNLWPNAELYAKAGGGIAVESVTVDGKAVPFTARALDLAVPLGRPVAQGEQVQVAIRFTTHVPGRITTRVFGQAPETKTFNLAHWYPILAVLDDRGWVLHPLPEGFGEPYSETSSYTVKLDVPAGTVLGATGHPASRTEQGGRWIYRYDAPNVRDWVAYGGPSLAEVDRKVGEITVRVLDSNQAAAAVLAEEAAMALGLFQPQFGNYPYKDLVVVPCCAGLEYPGLFYTSLPDPQNKNNWWHTVLYHELAHQWFFGLVGNDQYNEAWLDEGFARYGERLGNKTFGFTDQLRDIHSRTLPQQVKVNSSTVDFNVWGGYVAGVYDLAAVALEDLEDLVGPETFRQIMRTYVQRYQFKTATTADFVRTAEEVSKRDLQQFFRDHKIDAALREPYRPVMPLGAVKPQ